MIIFPAIDIRGGKAVRLVEGDFSRETIFDDDPVDAALRWEQLGATHIHIVDLDGARDGLSANFDAIQRIRSATTAFLQVGGGIRSLVDADRLIVAGIDRIVLGSVLVKSPEVADSIIERHAAHVAAGLDARDGMLATEGWTEQSEMSAIDMAGKLQRDGVGTVIYTDIRRDGTLAGPNLEALAEMIAMPGVNVIASGGIGDIADVHAVHRLGAAAVIIGRALYDNRVDLTEALKCQQ